MKHAIILVLTCLSLAACKSTSQGVLSFDPDDHLYDQHFPEYRFYAIEREEEVFGLSPEAEKYVQRHIRSIDNIPNRMRKLLTDIFRRADYNLLYQNSANTIAAETFRTGAANCLSLSILTYALANEAGLQASFQDVEIPEYWTRREGHSLLNGHINVKILPQKTFNFVLFGQNGIVVDFYQMSVSRSEETNTIDKDRVLAMFYNNKGADSLINGDYERAYAYFYRAVQADPEFDSIWVNLGYLYRLVNAFDQAEKTYNLAVRLNPDNLTAYENLAVLYQMQGRIDEATSLAARVERRRQSNPYYHFVQGEEAFDNGEFETALAHYRRALRLNSRQHEFYFGLAKAHYKLGEYERSQDFMRKAKHYSPDEQLQSRYAGKMALLQQL